MSRIGKLPIKLPSGVTVSVADNNTVTVKGPKGSLNQVLDPDMKVNVEDSTLTIERPTEQKRHRALHGLYRALLSNMVKGVSEGFKIQQELVGIGYKATNQGQLLDLVIGYSHEVMMEIPAEIKIT